MSIWTIERRRDRSRLRLLCAMTRLDVPTDIDPERHLKQDGEWHADITLSHEVVEFNGYGVPLFEGDVERREWERRRCAKDRRRTWTPMTMVEVMPVSEHEAERALLIDCAEGWSQCAAQWLARARGLEEAAREVLDALGHQNRHPIIDEALGHLRSACDGRAKPSPNSQPAT